MSNEKKNKVLVYITGEICKETYDMVWDTIIKNPDCKEYVLIINSFGGDTEIGFAIYDLFKSLNKPITTIAFGFCISMGTVLFALGNKRYASQNLSYILHQPSKRSTELVPYNVNQAYDLYLDLLACTEKWKHILMKTLSNCADIDLLNDAFDSSDDAIVSVDDLLKMGLATEIIEDITSIIFD